MRIVAKYRIQLVEALARQMSYTPRAARLSQVEAGEALLHSIDPLKAYPFDYVVHRITGYRPRAEGEDLYAGSALQHDLGLLIEQVSDTLDVLTDEAAEPVLTIEDVTARFNVTSKTIQRWRRRGLPARRFLFPDGKRRVGFLLGSVERFFAGHQDQVARGMNFSQVGDQEREQILRRARRLATYCHCCVHEISRRIGRMMNRSPLTIQHTIRKHDEAHPDQAIFPQAAPELAEEERSQILRGYRRGLALRTLARRACRSRSAVFRVIVEERLAKINRRKIKFIDDPLYHGPDAAEAVEAIVRQAEQELPALVRPEDARVPRDLPTYLADLYRTPLLTPARERALFLKFNFHKHQFTAARRRVEPEFVKLRDVERLEALLTKAIEAKNQIVAANLRLVVSVARKHLRPGLSLMELVSDGNITLMRAVEGFDAHRGHRFSTYATLALMKGFARSVSQMLANRRIGSASDLTLAALADVRPVAEADRFHNREEVGELLSQLDDRERSVLLAHYGLDDHTPAAATYDQVADRLGLSRQQVRQIEKTALSKLRSAAAGAPDASSN